MNWSRLLTGFVKVFLRSLEQESSSQTPAKKSSQAVSGNRSSAVQKSSAVNVQRKYGKEKGWNQSLRSMALHYQSELSEHPLTYTFEDSKGRKVKAEVDFDENGFCHLFSIGSIAKAAGLDPADFSGREGWNRIMDGRITFDSLKKLDPDQFAYYHPEHLMLDEMIEVIRHPKAVIFDASTCGNTRLEASVMLYGVFDDKTVHVALDHNDGRWFVRSYFVRDNDRDRKYPTRYIYGMAPLKVKVSSRNA